MIYDYGLEYAQEYLDKSIKLSKQAQNEVKELLLHDFVNYLCDKFIAARDINDEKEYDRISKLMKELSKIHMFNRIRYGYKEDFIHRIIFYKAFL